MSKIAGEIKCILYCFYKGSKNYTINSLAWLSCIFNIIKKYDKNCCDFILTISLGHSVIMR